jgi:hypothetical protein
MSAQMNLFTGTELRDAGIAKAMASAERETEGWSDLAYKFLLHFIASRDEFMMEDVREAAIGIVPMPPSVRAWGGIAIRARKAGRIERIGFRNVNNPKAHCTPATVWRVKNR